MKQLKQLYSAFFENLAADPASGLNKGRVYWNTTFNDLRIYNGSSWVSLDPTASTPAGIIVPFGGITAPGGYVDCDGSSYDSIAQPIYADLFAAIGTTWGGINAANFMVPDLRGGYLKGVGSNGQTAGTDIAALGDFQDDATDVNGASVNYTAQTLTGTTSFSSTTHTHNDGSLHSQLWLNDGADELRYKSTFQTMPTPDKAWSFPVNVTEIGLFAGGGGFSVPKVEGDTGTPSATGTVTINSGGATLQSTDNETRPKSYGVNYVIKI